MGSSVRLILVAILAAAGCDTRTLTFPMTQVLEYEVTPKSEQFLAGEEVTLRVRISNHGSDTVQIPDPMLAASTQFVHTISGPCWPDGVRFSNSRRLQDGEGDGDGKPTLIPIAPGAAWEGVVPVTSFLSLTEEGDYRVHSEFNFQGVKAQSKESRFQVTGLKPRSIHLGMGTRPLQSGEGEGAFLDAGAVYSFTYHEIRTSIGEPQLNRPIRRASVRTIAN